MNRHVFFRTGFVLFLLMVLPLLGGMPDRAEAGWYWLSSDDHYSKYFDPESVVVTNQVDTARGLVPTEIQVWTKTAYSYGGAQETLQNYGLNRKITNPASLAYSTAQLLIRPQYRTVRYLQESFYDSAGNVIWSRSDGTEREKEITSQQFDEAFYDAAVDQAFHQSAETERAAAKDRWTTIYDEASADGVRVHITADTTTMRMRGDNLVYWAWKETKDANGKVVEIQFLKMAVNLPQATAKIISGKSWTAQTGWQSMDESLDGQYRMISKTSSEYKMIRALRSYVQANSKWVNRYSLE